MHRIDRFLNLTKQQWSLLHAVADHNLTVGDISDDLQFLVAKGLIEYFKGGWQATDNGHLLAALRREV